MRVQRKIAAVVGVLCLLVLSGCETAEGIGRDTQKAGQWIERQASDDDAD